MASPEPNPPEPDPGSPHVAAEQMATVLAASIAPFGCMYGCAVGLLWLLGGAIVGLLLVLASHGFHFK